MSSFYFNTDGVQAGLKFFKNLPVQEPNYENIECTKVARSVFIVARLVPFLMVFSIKLDGNSGVSRIEIQDIRPDSELAAEFYSIQFSGPQLIPHYCFCRSLALSKSLPIVLMPGIIMSKGHVRLLPPFLLCKRKGVGG